MVTQPAGSAPVALRLAAAAQAAEAVGLCVAGVFSAVSTADGKSYELASGVALTVIAFTLLDGHRPEWGWPALALAVAALAGLFTPASLRALNRAAR
jgi:hypothetical protein